MIYQLTSIPVYCFNNTSTCGNTSSAVFSQIALNEQLIAAQVTHIVRQCKLVLKTTDKRNVEKCENFSVLPIGYCAVCVYCACMKFEIYWSFQVHCI